MPWAAPSTAWCSSSYATTNVITVSTLTTGGTGDNDAAVYQWMWNTTSGSTLAEWQRQPARHAGAEQYEQLQRAMREINRQCEPPPQQPRANGRYYDERRCFDAASDRARQLLESLLSNEQLVSLRVHRYFDVIAPSGNRYRIYEGSHGNVALLEDGGREECRYCAQPDGVPTADMMLAQKLQLEADEQGFLAVANERPAQRAA